MTPDSWQGDEGKWQQTFLAGTGSIRMSKGKKNDRYKKRLSRVIVTIVDLVTNRVIGVVTIGVNVDELS